MISRGKWAVAATAAPLLALAGAAYAAPEGKKDGEETRVRKVIVITEHDGAKAGAAHRDGAQVHSFRLERDGPHGGGTRVFHIDGRDMEKCDGGNLLVNDTAGDEKNRSKVIICSRGKDAKAAEHLEQALARIEKNDELSAEQKARIETALKNALERVRTAQ